MFCGVVYPSLQLSTTAAVEASAISVATQCVLLWVASATVLSRQNDNCAGGSHGSPDVDGEASVPGTGAV